MADIDGRNTVILYKNSDTDCALTSTDVSANTINPSDVCIDEPRALVIHPQKVIYHSATFYFQPQIVKMNSVGLMTNSLKVILSDHKTTVLITLTVLSQLLIPCLVLGLGILVRLGKQSQHYHGCY